MKPVVSTLLHAANLSLCQGAIRMSHIARGTFNVKSAALVFEG